MHIATLCEKEVVFIYKKITEIVLAKMCGTRSCRHLSMLLMYGTSSQADSVSLNQQKTSLQKCKYISERGVMLGLMLMAALLLDRTKTSINNIFFSVNTFSFILHSTTLIDMWSLQDLQVTLSSSPSFNPQTSATVDHPLCYSFCCTV